MLKKLNFGIIGISKGNGHPFSFSAIINGINKDKFKKNCNYDVIKKYIFKNKVPNKKLINIKINSIWTHNSKISKKISECVKIDNIIDNYKYFKNIDGLIIARDDLLFQKEIINHYSKKKLPILIDKQISNDLKFLEKLKRKKIKLFGGSALAFSDELNSAITKINKKKNKINYIEGVCKGNWDKYGQHLLHPIIKITKKKPTKIDCFYKNKEKTFVRLYFSNFHCDLYFYNVKKKNIYLKIHLKKEIIKVKFLNTYKMFVNFLYKFYTSVTKNNFNTNEILLVSKLILKGEKEIDKFKK